MDTPKSGDSFAALFEQQGPAVPRRRTLRVGEKIDATVVKVGRDTVFVELDGTQQAYMDAAELRSADGTIHVKVGDVVTAQVVEVDERTGGVRIGRTIGKPGSLAGLEQARATGLAVEGKVTGVNKGGLEVDVDGTRAFCPISHADNKFVSDASSLVGKTLAFAVTDIRDGGKSVVLSRKVILEREARDALSRLLRDLVPGTTMRGTVTAVREFGAFVDLGGVEGLIPASEISHDRSATVGDLIAAGDVVDVQICDVKEAPPQRSGDTGVKVTLSLKALTADPWDAIESVLSEGQVAVGTVVKLADFGAFVRLSAGIEGLVHVTELGGKVDHPARVLKVGQPVTVVIRKIDRPAKKLSLVPAPQGMSAGARLDQMQIAIGAIVQGVVDRVETYGVFMQIAGTAGRAGRGLIPNAELGIPRGADARKAFPEGSKVAAKVLETGEGRLRLSIRAMRDDEERAQFDGYREKVAAPAKLGTLGDLMSKKRLR